MKTNKWCCLCIYLICMFRHLSIKWQVASSNCAPLPSITWCAHKHTSQIYIFYDRNYDLLLCGREVVRVLLVRAHTYLRDVERFQMAKMLITISFHNFTCPLWPAGLAESCSLCATSKCEAMRWTSTSESSPADLLINGTIYPAILLNIVCLVPTRLMGNIWMCANSFTNCHHQLWCLSLKCFPPSDYFLLAVMVICLY